jgi:hypothetical protein
MKIKEKSSLLSVRIWWSVTSLPSHAFLLFQQTEMAVRSYVTIQKLFKAFSMLEIGICPYI